MNGFEFDYLDKEFKLNPGGARYKRRTVEDLMKIELEPSNWILFPDCHADTGRIERTNREIDQALEKRLEGFYDLYRRRVAADVARRKAYYSTYFNAQHSSRFDRIRYALHLKLLQWKVII